jgi:inosine-uridine nucleoside N-ribohydrolase
MKRIIILINLVLLGYQIANAQAQKHPFPVKKKISVILDTDMGNDIDDALALDMLFKYMDHGKVKLLGIATNKDSEYATRFLDLFSTWYGYPKIPIGMIQNGVKLNDYVDYCKNIVDRNAQMATPYPYSIKDHKKLLASDKLYRKILSQQADHSVVVISVGFFTNLNRLLKSGPDEYSKLSGPDLVARKVTYLSVMAGSFGDKQRAEFNVIHDLPAARYVFENWPTGIVLSPFEVGAKVSFPAKSILEDFNWASQHPLIDAYKHYRPFPYDRPTWDLTSVYYAVEGSKSNLLTISEPGTLNVDERGFSHFKKDATGKHFVLSIDEHQAPNLKQYFIDLIKLKPKNHQ